MDHGLLLPMGLGLNFGSSLHLHLCFVHASNEGSREPELPEHWLLADVINKY